MTDLAELLRRCEEAGEGSRQLDFNIVRTFAPGAIVGHYMDDDDGDIVFHAQALGISNKHECPHYTSSIDAALALVSRKLPGWDWIIGHTNDGLTIHCRLGPYPDAFGATAPLAIICALLTALISEQARVLNNTEDGNG